jgi:hypothetical protein
MRQCDPAISQEPGVTHDAGQQEGCDLSAASAPIGRPLTIKRLHLEEWQPGAAGTSSRSMSGHKACRNNRSVLYQRIPRMFGDLALARGDGRYPRLMRALGGVKLLILDDWVSSRSGPSSATTCWKSSKIATAAAPH